MRDAVAVVLLWAGVGMQVLCCAGVVLMPSALARLHYAAPGGVAAALVAAALLVRDGLGQGSGRAIMLAALLAASGPVLGHVSARAIHARSRAR